MTFQGGQETHDITSNALGELAGPNGTVVRNFNGLKGKHQKTK